MKRKFSIKAFTLIELLVVIAIIGLLSSVILAPVQNSRKKARDAKRLSEMKQMQTALAIYYDENGQYPDSDGLGCGGWDTPGDGTFIGALITGRYLPAHLRDPITNDSCGNFRYYRYSAGSYGCLASKGAFYILGVVDMETSGNPHPASGGFSCSGRNWQGEFDYVVGSYEN